MAQPFVPGPCHVFVTIGPNSILFPNTTKYLGLTARGLNIQFRTQYDPYQIDIAGSVPQDGSYQGTTATVSGDFVRWDYGTYEIIQDKVSLTGIAGGLDVPGEIGALMTYEGAYVQLLLVFPYSLKPAYATQPKGYRFLAATVEQEGLPERGAKPSRLSLTFHCWRPLDMRPNGSILGPGILSLWDNDVGAANFALIS